MHWIFKNKDHGKAAATASLGMITLWDVQGGLPLLDKYLYSKDSQVMAGCLLGIGILCCGTQDEHDPAFALLYDSIMKVSHLIVCPCSPCRTPWAGWHWADCMRPPITSKDHNDHRRRACACPAQW